MTINRHKFQWLSTWCHEQRRACCSYKWVFSLNCCSVTIGKSIQSSLVVVHRHKSWIDCQYKFTLIWTQFTVQGDWHHVALVADLGEYFWHWWSVCIHIHRQLMLPFHFLMFYTMSLYSTPYSTHNSSSETHKHILFNYSVLVIQDQVIPI